MICLILLSLAYSTDFFKVFMKFKLSAFMIHQIFSLSRDSFKRVSCLNTREYPNDIS